MVELRLAAGILWLLGTMLTEERTMGYGLMQTTIGTQQAMTLRSEAQTTIWFGTAVSYPSLPIV